MSERRSIPIPTRAIDMQIGRQVRRRRRLMGLTQAQLAQRIGVTPQQIQKYECGGARMSAGRLHDIARSLEAPIDYFYAGLHGEAVAMRAESDVMASPETLELIAAYYGVPARSRRHLLDLAKALNDPLAPSAASAAR